MIGSEPGFLVINECFSVRILLINLGSSGILYLDILTLLLQSFGVIDLVIMFEAFGVLVLNFDILRLCLDSFERFLFHSFILHLDCDSRLKRRSGTVLVVLGYRLLRPLLIFMLLILGCLLA